MTKKAYILVGPSGAGKSTFTKTLGEDVSVFSLDKCRMAFYGWSFTVAEGHIFAGRPRLDEMILNFPTDKQELATFYAGAFNYCNENSKDFDAFVTESWRASLNAETVVVDNTNASRKSRARWSQELKKAGFHITIVEFMVTVDTVVARQSTRPDKSVPESIVRQQYMRVEEALLGSECDEIKVIRSE